MAKGTVNTREEIQRDIMVTSTEIAKLIGKTNKTVQDLTRDGVLPAVETKNKTRVSRKYNKYETIQAYIDFIEERAKKQNGGDKEKEKLQVEIDIKKTKLKVEELKLGELESRMHAAEDVEAMTDDLVLNIRSDLLALPGRLAVDLAEVKDASEIAERIQNEVYEILEDLSNYEYDKGKYEKRVRERKNWTNKEPGEDEET